MMLLIMALIIVHVHRLLTECWCNDLVPYLWRFTSALQGGVPMKGYLTSEVCASGFVFCSPALVCHHRTIV